MQINAQMVKELRATTGAGMMDCKRALQETEGDIEKAIEYLRTKGLAAAEKKASRAAAEDTLTMAPPSLFSKTGTKLRIISSVPT